MTVVKTIFNFQRKQRFPHRNPRDQNSMNVSSPFRSQSYADFWPFPSPLLNMTTCLVAAVVAGIFLYFSYSFTSFFEYVRSKIISVISHRGSVAAATPTDLTLLSVRKQGIQAHNDCLADRLIKTDLTSTLLQATQAHKDGIAKRARLVEMGVSKPAVLNIRE